SLLMIVPALPSILLSILPVKAQAWMYAIPVVGQNLAITRLMRGDSVAAPALAACVAGSALAAAIAIAVTARIYRSERLAISA
ncbi:MAG TPA: ABC transporter permease, partial [Mizugakiibacter sp.]